MTRYHVGDRVVVSDAIQVGSGYYMDNECYANSVVEEMLRWRGKVVTISRVREYGYGISEGWWTWTDDMFSGLEDDALPSGAPEDISEESFTAILFNQMIRS